MRLNSKFIIWSWVVLLLILSALIFGAYTQLKPESLVSLLRDQVTRNYPGSELKVQNLDYTVSLDFSLKLQDMSLVRNGKSLFNAKEVHFKIPWWLVLFNRGNAQINIKYLDLYTSEKKSEKTPQATSNPKAAKVDLSVPKYLVDANYTLRAEQVSVKELESGRNLLTLSRLLVREFQFGRNSAFEMTIPISITHRDKKFLSELWLFGDLTPAPEKWNINFRGEFKTRDVAETFQFEDLIIDGKSSFNPLDVDLNAEIELTHERKKIGSGTFNAKLDNAILSVQFSEFPLSYLSLIDEELKNPFFPPLLGVAVGQMQLVKSLGGGDRANLQAKLSFPGKFMLGDQGIDGQWQLNFNNDKLECSFITANGDVNFFRRSLLDFEAKRVTQFSQELGFRGVDLQLAMRAVEKIGNYLVPESQPYHSSFVAINRAPLGETFFTGTFRYGTSPYQKFYQAEVSDDKSKMQLSYMSKSSQNQLEMNFNNFRLNSNFIFLSPYFLAESAALEGKIQGNWGEQWQMGKWLVNLKVSDLKNGDGEFYNFLRQLWSSYNLEPVIAEKQTWNASVSDRSIKLTTLTLDTSDPAKLSGLLYMDPLKKSYLTLNYPKNKKWKPVKKELTESFWRKDTP